MPFDAAGNYSIPAGSTATTGQTILASQHNTPIEDMASALSATLLRDGRAAATDDIPMGGHKITGLADGVADDDAATVSQLATAVDVGNSLNSAASKETPVDNDRMLISDSEDGYSIKKFTLGVLKTFLSNFFALRATTVTGGGVATGGGDLSANRTITVTEATQVQAQALADTATVITPRRFPDAFNAAVASDVGNTSLVDFPIGTYLLVNEPVPTARTAVGVIRLSLTSSSYTMSGAGTVLTGTWRNRGSVEGTAILFQRVS